MSRHICSLVRVVTPMIVGILTIPAEAQSVLYVDAKAPAGGDGRSWATAYRYLQDALTAAAPGSGASEIRVAAGVYKPDQGRGFTPGDRLATFNLIENVAIRGGYAGIGSPNPHARDMKVNETILSGDLLGNDGPGFENYSENSEIVVTAGEANLPPILEGFTVTGGAGKPAYGVGGVFIFGASHPTLAHLNIRANRATGIGVNSAGYLTFARPFIVNCLIAENYNYQGGGASAIATAEPTFINCVFLANTATGQGGGLYTYNGRTTLVNCSFVGNRAPLGGAI